MPIFKFDSKNNDLYFSKGIINKYRKDKAKQKESIFNDSEPFNTYNFYNIVTKLIVQKIDFPTKEIYDKIININKKEFSRTKIVFNKFIQNLYNKNKYFNLNSLFKNYINPIFNRDNQSEANIYEDIIGKIFGILYCFPENAINNGIINYINDPFIKEIFKAMMNQIEKLNKLDFTAENNILEKYQKISKEVNKLSILNLFIEDKTLNQNNITDLELINKLDKEISIINRLKELFPEIGRSLNNYLKSIYDKKISINATMENRNINNSDKKIEIKKIQLDEEINLLIKNNNNSNSNYSKHYL